MKFRNAWAALGCGASLKITQVSIQYRVPSSGTMYSTSFVSSTSRSSTTPPVQVRPRTASSFLIGTS